MFRVAPDKAAQKPPVPMPQEAPQAGPQPGMDAPYDESEDPIPEPHGMQGDGCESCQVSRMLVQKAMEMLTMVMEVLNQNGEGGAQPEEVPEEAPEEPTDNADEPVAEEE